MLAIFKRKRNRKEVKKSMHDDKREYSVIVRFYHDEPAYLTTSMRNIKWWENNPEVRAVEIIG